MPYYLNVIQKLRKKLVYKIDFFVTYKIILSTRKICLKERTYKGFRDFCQNYIIYSFFFAYILKFQIFQRFQVFGQPVI